jgi:hypothetical protein
MFLLLLYINIIDALLLFVNIDTSLKIQFVYFNYSNVFFSQLFLQSIIYIGVTTINNFRGCRVFIMNLNLSNGKIYT